MSTVSVRTRSDRKTKSKSKSEYVISAAVS